MVIIDKETVSRAVFYVPSIHRDGHDEVGMWHAASLKEDSLRGQIVEFFSELDRLLYAGARDMGDCLDKMENVKLLDDANQGLKSRDKKVLAEAKKRDKLREKAEKKKEETS